MHTDTTLPTEYAPTFRWPISVTRKISAPPEKVWDVISSRGNLAYCHPFCEKNPVEKWPGVGAHDSVHYYSGLVYVRDFTRWFEGVGYDIEVGRKNGRTSLVSWRVRPERDSESSLTITIKSHAYQQIPLVLRWFPHHFRLRPMLRSYLSAVLKGFEYYIVTGQPVQRNQFGSHSLFSP